MVKLYLKIYHDYNKHIKDDETLQLTTISLWKISLEQSMALEKIKTGISLRAIVILYIIFSLVNSTGYKSKLVSFLTNLDREIIPRTHKELSNSLDQYNKILFRYYGGVAYSKILNSNDSVHKSLVPHLNLVNNSFDCIIPVILEDNTVCMDFDMTGDFIILANATLFSKASIIKSNGNYNNNYNGQVLIKSIDSDFSLQFVLSFHKFSPLLETFNQFLLNCEANGLMKYWWEKDRTNIKSAGEKWLRTIELDESIHKKQLRDKLQTILKGLSDKQKSIPLGSIKAIFYVLGLSYIAGFLILCIEFVYFTWKIRSRKTLVRKIQRKR